MAASQQPSTKYTSQGRFVLLSTILASAMAFISSSSLNVALPALQEALGATGSDLLWITNIYLLLLAALILVGGSLGDHYGRKRIFGYGIILFTIGSIACGFAMTVDLLLAARVVQGIGGAMMIPGSLAIISAFFDDTTRGGAIGLWSAFVGVTTVGGPIIGGILVDNGLWRGVFFMNVPLAIVALFTLYRYVPESYDEDAPKRLDYVGAVLITAALAGITYGFIRWGEAGLNTLNISSLIAGFALLVTFVWWEGTTNHPMMPLGLFKSPVFAGTNALTLLLYAALQGVFFFFALNLIQVQGYSPLVAGFSMLPFSIILILMSQQAGAISDRIGARLPLTIGPFVTGVGFAALAIPGLTNGASSYWWTYLPGILLGGLGMGMTVAPLTSAVMGSVPQHNAGTASGINNAVSRIAGVLAIAVMGGIMLIAFTNTLQSRARALELDEDMFAALMSEAVELGNAAVPDSVPAETHAAVQNAINWAFVDSFRIIALIGAGLAWLSAAAAWFILGGTRKQLELQP